MGLIKVDRQERLVTCTLILGNSVKRIDGL